MKFPLAVILPLEVLFVKRFPLIEDLLGCGSEHVFHRCLDQRALPKPHGSHRALPCLTVAVVVVVVVVVVAVVG